MTGYDVIGDVHGDLDALRHLLDELERRGARPGSAERRRVVFIGDLIDPRCAEPSPGVADALGCLELARHWVEERGAHCLLGNHELNLLHFLRGLREGRSAQRQLSATLAQIESDPARWAGLEPFVRALPLHAVLADGHLRAVHAAWDGDALDQLPLRLDSEALLERAAEGGDLCAAVETVLKGPEEEGPPRADLYGKTRTRWRVHWWQHYPASAPTVVFGHYHRRDLPPTPLGPGKNAVCIDYDLAGVLVAFRHPEREFVSVPRSIAVAR